MYVSCWRCRNIADISIDDQSQVSTLMIFRRSWRWKTIAGVIVNDTKQIFTFTINYRCQRRKTLLKIHFANRMPWFRRIHLELLPTVHDWPHDHVIRNDAFFEGTKILAWPRHHVMTKEQLLERKTGQVHSSHLHHQALENINHKHTAVTFIQQSPACISQADSSHTCTAVK